MTVEISNEKPIKPGVRRPSGLAIARALSAIGLVAVTVATLLVYRSFTPKLPSEATPTPSATASPGGSQAAPTAAPTKTVLVNPDVPVPGQLVYIRDGNLWIQSGTSARQLTVSGNGSVDSTPAFSPDGKWIYFIETRVGRGSWYTYFGIVGAYVLNYPVLCRIRPDGTGQEDMLSSLIKRGSMQINFFLTQPAVNPTSPNIAVVTDGPRQPGVDDVLIHYFNVSNKRLGGALNLPENAPLGLSEPAFSPDGQALAFTQEQRAGTVGSPSIWIMRDGTSRKLAAGYRSAAWSPDGAYIAATKVNGNKLDVVVLDASSGRQVGQVTSDGTSWGPVWAPDGKEIVYTHMTGPTVDLAMVYITGSGADVTFKIEPHLTDFTGLDGGSRPTWYIPGFGPTATPSPSSSAEAPMPSASPTDATAATPSPSASAS